MDAFFIGGGDGGGRYRGDGVDAAGAAGTNATSNAAGAAAAHVASTSTASGAAAAAAAAPGTEDNRVAGGVLHCIDNMAGAIVPSPPISETVFVSKQHAYVPRLSP